MAIQPFVTYDENGFYFDEESARKENVSEDLIESTTKDFELMNSVQPLVHVTVKVSMKRLQLDSILTLIVVKLPR